MTRLVLALLAATALGGYTQAQDWAVYTAENSGLPSDTVTSVLMSGDWGWVGTPAGLAQKSGDAWSTFTAQNSNLPHDYITALSYYYLSELAVGTKEGLLFLFGSEMTSPYEIVTQADGLHSDTVTVLRDHLDLIELPNGYPTTNALWVGTTGGLSLVSYDWNEGLLVQPIIEGYVEAIEETPDGRTLWVAIAGGAAPLGAGVYEYGRSTDDDEYPESWGFRAFYARPNVGLCLENTLALDFEGELVYREDYEPGELPYEVHFESLRAPYVMYGATSGGGTDACTEGESGEDPLVLARKRGRMGRYDGETWASSGGDRARGGGGMSLPEGIYTDVANFGGFVWVAGAPVEGGGGGGGLAYAPSGEEEGAWTVLRAGDEGVGLPSNTVLNVSVDGSGTVWTGTTAGLARYTPPLHPPLLSTPAHEAEQVPTTPVLQWGAAPSATRYQIQASTSPAFPSPEREWEVAASASTEFVVPEGEALGEDTQYYWRIRTQSGSDLSPWSDPMSFTTGGTVAVHHAVEAGGVEVDPAGGGAVWVHARNYLSHYDGVAWANSDWIRHYYPDETALDLPDYEVLSVGSDGAVWVGAGPSYDVAGPDFYTTNPGFLTRRTPEPSEYVAGTEFPPSGYSAVAAEGAGTTWACKTTFSSPPEMAPGSAVLQHWSGGTLETYEEVAGCRAVAVDPVGGAWVAGEAELYHVNGGEVSAVAVPFSDGVTAVALSPDGRVWAGSEGGGVAAYDRDAEAWTTHTASASPVLGAPTHAFAFDGVVVWIATGSGLARYDGTQWHAWSRENGTFPTTSVDDVAVQDGGTVWVAAGRAVELHVPSFPVDTGAPPVPEGLALHPAYPNPMRAGATLTFDVPAAGPVTLAVYDVLGRRVATLVDEHLPGGLHRAVWEVDGVASGVYVARLTGGPGQVTRKITLVR